jgi:hypothetical protein
MRVETLGMLVETLDGKLFKGVDMKELVRAMKVSTFSPPRRVKDYMEQVKERTHTLYGVSVRVDNVSNFLADLEEHGLIKIRRGVMQ